MRVALTLIATILLGCPGYAFDLAGTKVITLVSRDGKAFPIGTVDFTPKGATSNFAVHIDTSKFKDFFLSMREFKCLEGPDIECYVP